MLILVDYKQVEWNPNKGCNANVIFGKDFNTSGYYSKCTIKEVSWV